MLNRKQTGFYIHFGHTSYRQSQIRWIGNTGVDQNVILVKLLNGLQCKQHG